MMDLDSVADSRAVTINVHYSLSLLPQNGYRPRLADDRVGYFVTAMKDYSHKVDEDRFVRYITRWDLQKAEPTAEQSPPKKPIVFWIEKTVPFKYRKPIREGILEWNKAFEKAGLPERDRSPPAARQRRLGPRRRELQHVPLDHLEREVCDGSVAGQSAQRADPQRLDHLRRRLPAVLEDGVRNVHPAAASPPSPAARSICKTYEDETARPFRTPTRIFDNCTLEEEEGRQFAFGSAVLHGAGRRPGRPTEAEARADRHARA